MARTRVVITGMGTITPVGLSVAETWANVLAGKSGIGPIEHYDASQNSVRIAGEVRGFNPELTIPRKEARRMARCSQFAIAAATEAAKMAGLTIPLPDGECAGTVIGTGVGGFDWGAEASRKYYAQGEHGMSPFSLAAALPNMPSFQVSLAMGAKGPMTTPVGACAAGVQGIGEGFELIRHGRADIVFAGGTEGLVVPESVVGFTLMGALSTRNDAPQEASRPFDVDRDGFVVSEGCGVMVLEKLEHALERGATIYGEVLGFATSADAFHIAQPDPEAMGARRAMRWALEDSGLALEAIDYVNAHGTSTPLNDPTETYAIKQIFGDHAYRLAVNSTKSMIGHTLGGAGAIESIMVVMSLKEGMLHPTINLHTPDPKCDLDYVPNVARPAKLRYAMKNAFGFGGQNACLIFGRYDG